MISFHPTAEESAFVDVAKNLSLKKIRPAARKSEETRLVDKALINEIEQLGLLTLELPEEWGGLELPLISQVQIMQSLSYGDLGIVQGLPGASDAASLIRLLSENKKLDVYKNQVISGAQPTVALLDMTDNEDPFNNLTIKKNGANYIIDGISQPVRLAEFAEYVAITTVDQEGDSLILWLDKGSGHEWKVEKGDYRLGLLASGIARISFENLQITNDYVLAKGDGATKLIDLIQTRIRILQAAKEVGLMEAALDYATEYTASRKAFGQEVAKFQGVSFRIAAMAIETRSTNHLVWMAATKADENSPDAKGSALRALYRAHRSLRYVTDSAVQLLGGHGYVQEFPVEKWMRDAQAQVGLYGRERNLLTQHGEQLIGAQGEVSVT